MVICRPPFRAGSVTRWATSSQAILRPAYRCVRGCPERPGQWLVRPPGAARLERSPSSRARVMTRTGLPVVTPGRAATARSAARHRAGQHLVGWSGAGSTRAGVWLSTQPRCRPDGRRLARAERTPRPDESGDPMSATMFGTRTGRRSTMSAQGGTARGYGEKRRRPFPRRAVEPAASAASSVHRRETIRPSKSGTSPSMSGAAPPTVHPGIDSQRARPRLIPGGAIGWFVDAATVRARPADRSAAVPGCFCGARGVDNERGGFWWPRR